MTYCNLETEDIRRFRKLYSMEELSAWFEKLCLEYQKWCDFEIRWKEKRQASIKKIEFPFPYREGQRDLAQRFIVPFCGEKSCLSRHQPEWERRFLPYFQQ